MTRRRNVLRVWSAHLVVLAAAGASGQDRRIPAFPGAEGFGATTPGGRGGRIIEVTNLNTSGPGSLNAACTAEGPRIVVFRVSGEIKGRVSVSRPYITIAGQTAPRDGICIRDGGLSVSAHDVIIRYLRVRPGDDFYGPTPSDRDGLHIRGEKTRDVVIDHCSISWAIDENVSIVNGAHNLTLQWCITSEALYDSLHFKGPHSMGMLVARGVNNVSLHHCLFAFNGDRNPLLSFSRDKTPRLFDLRNNVIYQGDKLPRSKATGHVHANFVGNMFKAGRAVELPTGANIAWRIKDTKFRPMFYAEDNIWPAMPKGKVDPWLAVWPVRPKPDGPPLPAMPLAEPLPAPPVTTEPAEQAFESVVGFAGCTRPVRDVVDDRVTSEARDGTGRTIDDLKEIGGWPTYASTVPPVDTDHDGMPDTWERRFKLDPKDGADGPEDLDGDGYTNVEEFLNDTDPMQPDTGAPVAQRPVKVQAGNDSIRRAAARKIGSEYLAKLRTPNAAPGRRDAFIEQVRANRKEVADVLELKFTKIEPGAFRIRSKTITLTKPYEIGIHEVTQAQWEAVMGTRPWSGQPGAGDDPKHPATYISYLDAKEFISRLNACDGRTYRLPTRCEWLWAAAGGTESPYGFGKDQKDLWKYAWCHCKLGTGKEQRPRSPQAVGTLEPNAYGLYDMAGNTAEWVQDWSWWTPSRDETDPKGPAEGTWRAYCGGYFLSPDYYMLIVVTSRMGPHQRKPGMGLRLCRELP